jgi:dynein heavy chain 2
MERVQRLIEYSLQGGEGLQEVINDPRMGDFLEGKSTEIRLAKTDGKVSIVTESRGADLLLTMRRKNREKINPKKPLEDIYISKSLPSSLTNANIGQTMLAAVSPLLPVLNPSSTLSLQGLLHSNGMSTAPPPTFSKVLETYGQLSKDSLDRSEKARAELIHQSLKVYDREISSIRSPDNSATSAHADLDKIDKTIAEFAQGVSSMMATEGASLPSEKDLKVIWNAVANDIAISCDTEFKNREWWNSPPMIQRARNWKAVFTTLQANIKSWSKKGDAKDPKVESMITLLETMEDIYEVLRDAKAIEDENKAVRDEVQDIRKKLSEGKNIIELNRQLESSTLVETLLSHRRSLIRQLSRSSQVLNALNSLSIPSGLMRRHREMFREEEEIVHTQTMHVIRALQTEWTGIESGEDTDMGDREWPLGDRTVEMARQIVGLQRKVQGLCRFNQQYFHPPREDIDREARRYSGDMEAALDRLVQQWGDKAVDWVVDRRGKDGERLMDMDIDARVMTVHYSEDMILMVHMLDSLDELGVSDRINKGVREYIQTVKGRLREGIQLRGIADFYNGLGNGDKGGMMAIHKPLLINKIVALEEMVEKVDSGGDMQTFIKRAGEIVNGFEAENRTLQRVHGEILSEFAGLIQVDLTTGMDTWKKTVRKALSKIQGVTKGKEDKYVAVWTNYLGVQLMKVMAYQMKSNLLNISACIPRVETSARLHGTRISLYPPMAHIRSILYSQVEQVMASPLSISFSPSWSRLVETIPGECSQHLSMAYRQIDGMLGAVEEKMHTIDRWVGIGVLDSQKVSAHPLLSTGEGWRKVVESIKAARRDIERMDDHMDAGCVRIRIGSVKVQIEERLAGLLDGLIGIVDSTMTADREKIELFLDGLTSKMNYQPQSTEELREAWETFDGVQVKMGEFKQNVDSLEAKVYLVKTLGRTQTRAEDVLIRWRQLEERVRNFQGELRDKQEYMKGEIVNKTKSLHGELEKYAGKWQSVRLGENEQLDRKSAGEYSHILQEVSKSWGALKAQVERAKRDLEHFGLPEENLDFFDELDAEISKELNEWKIFNDFETVFKGVEEKRHVGNPKTAFEFQDLCTEWTGKVKGRKNKVEIFLAKLIEEYQAAWPGLKLMIGEAFQREHWNQLLQILGIRGANPDTLNFGYLVEKSSIILSKLDELKELSARAQGEVTIREAIQELEAWCATAEFELMDYTDTLKRRVPLIREWTDLTAKVGDNQALLQSIKDSKFFPRFRDRVGQFEKRLGGLDRHLARLNAVQRRWLYLEPIFNKGALPSEKPRFTKLNDMFVEIMRTVEKNKKVAMLSEITGLESSLHEISEQIEVCQSALNKFLEETRNRFPRFFFLGDDDLLEILGQSENPSVIKLHLKKIFAGIFDVEFKNGGGGMVIQSMISSTGEVVELKTPVPVEANLEVWLNQLEGQMFQTLEESLLACIKDSSLNVSHFPGQILGLAKEIDFCHRAMEAIQKNKLQDLKKHLDEFLESLTKTKNKLGKVDQAKVKSLIMDVIHQVAVVEELMANRVTDPRNWYWFKQLKYFLSKTTKKCQVMMCRASFEYTYEYQGNPAKLVHTPLTDKCYLTLTQGMMLGLGGNPYGPAGTGKTESVKALGQCLARMVLVFNCDENLDYRSMGRIFVGLVKCGAWGCFDEFNRLIEEQLSAISQQIQLIQDALREKKPQIFLLGSDVNVNPNAGIFVTLNPAGKGYGGRSKLPDNLKLLFRPVAMARPDNELISEVMLYSEGFKGARRLARKIVNIFTLCRQLLSKQQHYDWGLRALKVILCTSGELMQASRADKTTTSPTIEEEILLKALTDNTASKLTSEDLARFEGLLGDVLPGVKVPEIRSEELVKAIESALAKHNFEVQERQTQKIVQFNAALGQRIGVVIMGPSGSGKTTIWSVLREALHSLGKTVRVYVMNPKASTRAQLLGFMDPNTREFHNGVLTAAARKVIKEPPNVLNWIVCDGDVDPKWIEALNSVLDDNHLLTLPTGERIAFGANVNFIFETHDLRFASPATVSRMGMIYLNHEDVNVSSLTKKWGKERGVAEGGQLNQLLADFFEPMVKLILQYENKQVVRTTRMGSIQSLLLHLTGSDTKKKFALASMRGIVGNYSPEVREEIIQKLGGILGEKLAFLSYFDEKQGAVVPYKPVVGEGRDNCVLTTYVQANLSIIMKVFEAAQTIVIVGPEGGGKNTILRRALTQLGTTTKVKTVTLHCNSQTSAQQVISLLLDSCLRSSTSTGPILRPKDCTRLVVFLRDVNLAKPDEYQSTELINFLQQIHSHRGFYDDELEFTQLDKNVQFVISMNPSSDIGRHELSTRLTACTHILFIDYPSKEDMKTIVKHMVEDALARGTFTAPLLKSRPAHAENIATLLQEVFSTVKATFTPEQQKHYIFTPKDISSILDSVLLYEVETIDELNQALMQEINLTFKARLTRPEEISKFEGALRKAASALSSGGSRDIVFTSLIKKDQQLSKTTMAGYQECLARGLLAFQREHLENEVCFTEQFVELIQTMDKILSRPGGKALLIGSSGSGRKMCTQLLSHMLNIEFETFSPGKGYSLKEFRKELRRIIESAGIQGKKTCMYIENSHIVDASFMEDFNSLLASNQVPGLFRPEEVESALKDQAEQLRDEFFGESLFECFLLRVRNNLRVIFSLDPLETNFSRYLTDNPAILKKCKTVWVFPPSPDSLRKISMTLVQKFFAEKVRMEVPQAQIDALIEIHRDAGNNPRTFYSTLEQWTEFIESTLSKLQGRKGHLVSGVEKIQAANKQVDLLSEKAAEQKRELKIKQDEAEKFLQKIQQTYESASDQKREAEQLQQFLQSEEAKTMDKRETIKVELDKVQPIVDAAKKQVGSISKAHISELKSFANPPPAVDDVFQALFKLNGEGSVSWSYMKKALANDSFFKGILNIDARSSLYLT